MTIPVRRRWASRLATAAALLALLGLAAAVDRVAHRGVERLKGIPPTSTRSGLDHDPLSGR